MKNRNIEKKIQIPLVEIENDDTYKQLHNEELKELQEVDKELNSSLLHSLITENQKLDNELFFMKKDLKDTKMLKSISKKGLIVYMNEFYELLLTTQAQNNLLLNMLIEQKSS